MGRRPPHCCRAWSSSLPGQGLGVHRDGPAGLNAVCQGTGGIRCLVLPVLWVLVSGLLPVAQFSGVPPEVGQLGAWCHQAACAPSGPSPGCISKAITEMAPISSNCWEPARKLSQRVQRVSHWGAGGHLPQMRCTGGGHLAAWGMRSTSTCTPMAARAVCEGPQPSRAICPRAVSSA